MWNRLEAVTSLSIATTTTAPWISWWILLSTPSGLLPAPSPTVRSMIRVLGIKMAKMTPSRGYSSELAVALVVAVFVYFGLPISTTHCIVSALGMQCSDTGVERGCILRPARRGE